MCANYEYKKSFRKIWHTECTVIFAVIIALRLLLTIFCVLIFCESFAQSDSFLQSLIDSAKAGATRTSPSSKDSQRKAANITPSKNDSLKGLRKDTGRTAIPRRDTARSIAQRPDSAIVNTSQNSAASIDTLQSKDLLTVQDSITAIVPVAKTLTWKEDTAFANLLSIAYKKINTTYLLKHDGDIHIPESKDYLFYLLVAIVLLLAIIKQLFPKYYQNIFQLMFQASFRQKTTREQMMQQALPALLMNILFILVGGLFISILADINKWLKISFWLLTVYSITLLAFVYIFKYLVIKFMGWVFNAREQASTYGFIVFLVNKVIGLALLPLLLLLAFSESGSLQQVTLTIAGFVVILLLIFRYIVSLTIIRNTLSIHPLHFFIYLCAVEIMPMLILYKVLFSFVGKSF